ncbi:hypothetical protein MIR68_008052 [Amoeboaphelidium protococcarum]|nr:hypothetical protein MIR68_008052 [Amoeboaphelidium protococcarum]
MVREAGFKKKRRSLENDKEVPTNQEQTQSSVSAPATGTASSSNEKRKQRALESWQLPIDERMSHKQNKYHYNLRSYSQSGAPRLQVLVASSSKSQYSSQSTTQESSVQVQVSHQADCQQAGYALAQSTLKVMGKLAVDVGVNEVAEADEVVDDEAVDEDEIHISLDEYNEQELADLHEYFDEVKLDLNDEHLVFIAIDPGVNYLATVVYIQAEEGRSALETLEVKLRQPIREGFQTKMIKTSDYHELVSSQLTAEEKTMCKDVFSTPKYTFHAVDCKMKTRDAALRTDQRMPLYMDLTIQKALFKEHFTKKSALQQIAKDICKLPRFVATNQKNIIVFYGSGGLKRFSIYCRPNNTHPPEVKRLSKCHKEASEAVGNWHGGVCLGCESGFNWDAIYEGLYEIFGIDGKKAYALKDEMGSILNKHVSREHLKVRSQMFADLSELEVESIQNHRGLDRDGFEYRVC